MIRLDFLGKRLDDIDFKVTRYVNDNLELIIQVLLEYLDDDNVLAEDFLPGLDINIENGNLTERIYDLYSIVQSDVPRDYVKPKYEYLLYVILFWWEECSDDDSDLIPIEISPELINDICRKYVPEEGEENYVLYAVTNYREYYDFLFQDHDFLPDSLERMVTIYLRSPQFFGKCFPDVELDEYRELMPRDLREQYDERKKGRAKGKGEETKKNEINVEQILYEDIVYCCERLQADNSLKNSIEDEINDKFRDLLDAKGYIERDQTRQGASVSGKRAGEIDILIKFGKMPLSLIEALKLTSMNEKYIAEHIDKIYRYDTLGYKYNFIISYVKIKDFKKFLEKYVEFVCSYQYPFEMLDYKIDVSRQYPELRCIEILLDRHGINTKLYNIVVHMPD